MEPLDTIWTEGQRGTGCPVDAANARRRFLRPDGPQNGLHTASTLFGRSLREITPTTRNPHCIGMRHRQRGHARAKMGWGELGALTADRLHAVMHNALLTHPKHPKYNRRNLLSYTAHPNYSCSLI